MKVTSKSRWQATQKSWATADSQRHGPEVGFAEIAIDLPQARFRPTSRWPTTRPESSDPLRTNEKPNTWRPRTSTVGTELELWHYFTLAV